MDEHTGDFDLLAKVIRDEFRRIMSNPGSDALPEFLHVGNDVYVSRNACTKEEYEKAIRVLLEEADQKARLAHDLANEAIARSLV